MKLLIAIPALNEEEAIVGIIERSLAAREKILEGAPIDGVDITVVSDGSTDKTVELASRYLDRIKLIVFEKNRGYGNAIQAAWAASDAELLGFIDADGTCDPNFFAPLCKAAVEGKADVVLGCRLNSNSKMPPIRRVGNLIFALMLSVFSSQRVRDTASGMRVVRRSSLPKLMPLPGGMHFTPAMSARAILSQDLKLIEIDMPYHEREGRSKLSVIKDGFRFLKVIIEAAFLYRPSRPLGLLAALFGLAAAGLMLMPSLYYLQHRSVLEWMIYRFVVSGLFLSAASLLMSAGFLAKKIVHIVLSNGGLDDTRPPGILGAFFTSKLFWLVPGSFFALGGWLVIPSFLELVRTGATYEHWSRFIAMSTLFSCALILVTTRVLDYPLALMASRLSWIRETSGASGAKDARPEEKVRLSA